MLISTRRVSTTARTAMMAVGNGCCSPPKVVSVGVSPLVSVLIRMLVARGCLVPELGVVEVIPVEIECDT